MCFPIQTGASFRPKVLTFASTTDTPLIPLDCPSALGLPEVPATDRFHLLYKDAFPCYDFCVEEKPKSEEQGATSEEAAP